MVDTRIIEGPVNNDKHVYIELCVVNICTGRWGEAPVH